MTFHPLNKLRHESGVILLTVVLVTMVISIVVLSIISMNVSQVKSAAQVVESVKAEQLAQGAFYQYYQAALEGTGGGITSETLDGRSFMPSVYDAGGTGNPNDTSKIMVTVSTY